MRRPLAALILAVAVSTLLLVAGMWLFSVHQSAEPVFQGKTLSEWLTEANVLNPIIPMTGGRKDNAAGASRAFQAMGTNAVPFLIRGLQQTDSRFQDFRTRLLYSLPMSIARYLSPPPLSANGVRQRSAWALGEIGPAAASALPDLRNALRDPSAEVRRTAIEAVTRVAPQTDQVVEMLIGALDERDLAVRLDVMQRLVRLGPKAARAVPAMAASLAEPDVSTRILIAAHICRLDPSHPAALQSLSEALSHEDKSVVIQAAMCISDLGGKVRGLTPALLKLQENPDSSVKAAAQRALSRVDPAAVGPAKSSP